MNKIYKKRKILGWSFVIILSVFCIFLSNLNFIKIFAISPLIIAVLMGAFVSNLMPNLEKLLLKTSIIGISTKQILRLGIILYGFKITIYDIAFVGFSGILISFIVVFSTFFIGCKLGKILGLDEKSSILISAGSSICGAAAVLATESLTKGGSQKVGVAVSTVVIFGTLFMFLYPLAYNLGITTLSANEMGFFIGATLHEVAHVVGASAAVGGNDVSIIIKMLRVLMLVPFLFMLGFFGSSQRGNERSIKTQIPYFAIWFLVAVGISSLFTPSFRFFIMPKIEFLDTLLLTIAMLCLGFGIKKNIFKKAGKKPFILATILALWLIFIGYILSKILI